MRHEDLKKLVESGYRLSRKGRDGKGYFREYKTFEGYETDGTPVFGFCAVRKDYFHVGPWHCTNGYNGVWYLVLTAA